MRKNKRRSKHRQPNGVNPKSDKSEMFEQKQLMQAMEQTIELFESFGADENPPYKYAFDERHGDQSPPSTKQRNLLNPDQETEPSVRESFERKVVPLNSKTMPMTSDLTSREGDLYSGSPTKMLYEAGRPKPIDPSSIKQMIDTQLSG